MEGFRHFLSFIISTFPPYFSPQRHQYSQPGTTDSMAFGMSYLRPEGHREFPTKVTTNEPVNLHTTKDDRNHPKHRVQEHQTHASEVERVHGAWEC